MNDERKHAGERLLVGASMVGGGKFVAARAREKHGIGRAGEELKAIRSGGLKAGHGKYGATWLATRGVVAAGIPISAVGARNLLAEKPKAKPVDVRHDVVRGSIVRTVPVPEHRRGESGERARARAAAAGVTAGAGVGGGVAGAKVASRWLKSRPLAAAVGGTAGTIAGTLASTPVNRRVVPTVSGGEYRYTRSGVRRVPVEKMSSSDASIKELPKAEQTQLIARKRKQSKYSLAGAGLGATALALRGPQGVRWALKRAKSPGLVRLRPSEAMVQRNVDRSNLVGVGSLGVGSVGSLNFARIQRAESKAEQRAVDKALLPRPVRFGGVRRGGLRMVRSTLGVRQVPVRGSLG